MVVHTNVNDFFFTVKYKKEMVKKKEHKRCETPSGTRTHSLLVRSQTPCPFGHKGKSRRYYQILYYIY